VDERASAAFIWFSSGGRNLVVQMSRSKRARAKGRRRAAAGSAQQIHTPRTPLDAESSRLIPARRRAAAAKVGICAVALVSGGVSMALARVTYAGHTKHPVHALSIPGPLYRVVRENLLQAGILAPATAPPDAATSTS
jgi:hypothetical protein